MSRSRTHSLIAIIIAFASFNATAAIYKWKDEYGQTHYSATPPAGAPAKKMGINTHYDTPAPAKAKKPSTKTNNKKTDDSAAKKDPYSAQEHDNLCSSATKDIDIINNSGRLRVKQKDGSTVVMTEGDRSKRLDAMKKIISEHCK